MTQRKDNSFALFKNDRKEKDTHADYQGTLTVNGQEFWINAWINEPKGGGQKYMSGTVKPKEQQRGAQQGKPSRDRDYDGGAPF